MGYPRKRAQSAAGPTAKRFHAAARRAGGVRGVRSLVRKELLRTAETKHSTLYINRANLSHNGWYYNNNMINISQGDGKDQMVGEEIFLRNLHVKLQFNSKQDRPQVMFRVLLLRVPADKNTTAISDLFEGSSNAMISMPNVSEVKILAEKTVRMSGTSHWTYASGSTVVQKDMAQSCELSCSLGSLKTRYDAGLPKFFNVRLAVVAFDAHTTLTSDVVADFEFTSRVFFKDP